MQKFGLDSQNSESLSGFELEIAKEQAESLGIAGKKLQESIDQFQLAIRDNETESRQSALLAEIKTRVWALIVQRELVGFRHETLSWVVANFDIPEAALTEFQRDDLLR